MKVAERFISINGEGQRAGELAVFLRFAGCNLSCTYCDTAWANAPDCMFTEYSAQENYAFVRQSGIRNVTLTGGEPLLAEGIDELLELLLSDGYLRVEIETNGSVLLDDFCGSRRPAFTVDYKLPGSGMEACMRTENFQYLRPQDTVKFVAGSREDLKRARAVIDEYSLCDVCCVYLSPVYGRIEPAEMVSFMREYAMNDVRLQLQMHKAIWDPSQRGV